MVLGLLNRVAIQKLFICFGMIIWFVFVISSFFWDWKFLEWLMMVRWGLSCCVVSMVKMLLELFGREEIRVFVWEILVFINILLCVVLFFRQRMWFLFFCSFLILWGLFLMIIKFILCLWKCKVILCLYLLYLYRIIWLDSLLIDVLMRLKCMFLKILFWIMQQENIVRIQVKILIFVMISLEVKKCLIGLSGCIFVKFIVEMVMIVMQNVLEKEQDFSIINLIWLISSLAISRMMAIFRFKNEEGIW